MTKTYSQQKRALILPALLTFSLGLGLLLLKVSSYAFQRSTERAAVAVAAREALKPPFGGLYLATAYVKDPESYQRQCDPALTSAIVKTSTWMLIRGPAVEVCLDAGPEGSRKTAKAFPARLK